MSEDEVTGGQLDAAAALSNHASSLSSVHEKAPEASRKTYFDRHDSRCRKVFSTYKGEVLRRLLLGKRKWDGQVLVQVIGWVTHTGGKEVFKRGDNKCHVPSTCWRRDAVSHFSRARGRCCFLFCYKAVLLNTWTTITHQAPGN